MVKKVAEQFGHLDVLVNNAGITRDKQLAKMSDEAKKLAAECWAAADSARISRLEIKTSCGDLVERMEDAIEAVNRAEVNRFALKGDCSKPLMLAPDMKVARASGPLVSWKNGAA